MICQICLCVDRTLKPIGQYIDLLNNIVGSHVFVNASDLSSLLVCWECRAILRKITSFQKKALEAQNILRMHEDFSQNSVACSLSTLTTVITKLFNDYDFKSEIPNENSNDSDCEVEIEDSVTENIDCNVEYNTEKPKNDKYKRKKSNYKIILLKKTKGEWNNMEYFDKVKLSDMELSDYLNSKRNDYKYKSKPYKCQSCVFGFANKRSYVCHRENYHLQKHGDFICNICEARKPTKILIEKHISEHYNKYACNVCSHTTYKRTSMYIHYKKKHQRIFQCSKCFLNFGSRRRVIEHHRELHDKFKCDQCGFVAKNTTRIEKHIRMHGPFVCKICEKTLKSYFTLYGHIKEQHVLEKTEKSYCVECNLQFNNVSRYKRHLKSSKCHREKKPVNSNIYPCKDCGKVFKHKNYYTLHYNFEHLKKRQHHCTKCDKYFLTKAKLDGHIKHVHNKIMDARNKICKYCDRGFTTRTILNNHIRTHTGEKPFTCELCQGKFGQKAALYSHVKNIHFSETKRV